MTKADRELVELTAELTVEKAINRMKGELPCIEHGEGLEVLKTQEKDNKKHTEENHKHIHTDRKVFLTGIGVIIIVEIVMKIFL